LIEVSEFLPHTSSLSLSVLTAVFLVQAMVGAMSAMELAPDCHPVCIVDSSYGGCGRSRACLPSSGRLGDPNGRILPDDLSYSSSAIYALQNNFTAHGEKFNIAAKSMM
jgi:hypothetical protein